VVDVMKIIARVEGRMNSTPGLKAGLARRKGEFIEAWAFTEPRLSTPSLKTGLHAAERVNLRNLIDGRVFKSKGIRNPLVSHLAFDHIGPEPDFRIFI
jgi:hypothetical protein